MATNFKNSAGTDLESIFEAGSGGPTTGFKNASNTDMGGLFLPVSYGSAASATGFKNSAGTDLGSLLCAKGTAGTQFTITVGSRTGSRKFPKRTYYSYGYSNNTELNYTSTIGSISPKTISGYAARNLYYEYHSSDSIGYTVCSMYIPYASESPKNTYSQKIVLNGTIYTCTYTMDCDEEGCGWNIVESHPTGDAFNFMSSVGKTLVGYVKIT